MDAFSLNRKSAASLALELFGSKEIANFMRYFDLRVLGVDNDAAINLMRISDIVALYKMLAKKRGTACELVDINNLVDGSFPDELTWTNSAYEVETIPVDEFIEEIIGEYVMARGAGLSRKTAYKRFAKYVALSTNHEAFSRTRSVCLWDIDDDDDTTLDDWLDEIAKDTGVVFD